MQSLKGSPKGYIEALKNTLRYVSFRTRRASPLCTSFMLRSGANLLVNLLEFDTLKKRNIVRQLLHANESD